MHKTPSAYFQELEAGEPGRQRRECVAVLRGRPAADAQLLQAGEGGDGGMEVDARGHGGEAQVGEAGHGAGDGWGQVVEGHQAKLQALQGGQGGGRGGQDVRQVIVHLVLQKAGGRFVDCGSTILVPQDSWNAIALRWRIRGRWSFGRSGDARAGVAGCAPRCEPLNLQDTLTEVLIHLTVFLRQHVHTQQRVQRHQRIVCRDMFLELRLVAHRSLREGGWDQRKNPYDRFTCISYGRADQGNPIP